MAKDQLREQKKLRRQRSNRRLRRGLSPDSHASPASHTPEPPRGPSDTGNPNSQPPFVPRQVNDQPQLITGSQSISVRSSYDDVAGWEHQDGTGTPSGASQDGSITAVPVPEAPYSEEIETIHQGQTGDLGGIQHDYETEVRAQSVCNIFSGR